MSQVGCVVGGHPADVDGDWLDLGNKWFLPQSAAVIQEQEAALPVNVARPNRRAFSLSCKGYISLAHPPAGILYCPLTPGRRPGHNPIVRGEAPIV